MQKTPDKNEENANAKNESTPEKQSTLEAENKIKNNSTSLKEIQEVECEFKTPNKNEENAIAKNESTPEKQSTLEAEKVNNSTPLKELQKAECEFKTPEKAQKGSMNQPVENADKTPEKTEHCNLNSEVLASGEGDDGMISTTEQARLLIAASKTPSKSLNKTPVKANTPSGKRSVENSPGTPGKYRRVELITLASPKAKRLKQI